MRLIVISNPVAGQHAAQEIWSQSALPLVEAFAAAHPALELTWDVYTTRAAGDGAVLVADALESLCSSSAVYLVVLGGDGTAHEALNGLVPHDESTGPSDEDDVRNVPPPPTTHMALIPTGTANALYARLVPGAAARVKASGLHGEHAWRLFSLRALLEGLDSASAAKADVPAGEGGGATRVPLTLVRDHLIGVDGATGKTAQEVLVAHVVSSHALHASILADSDSPELRRQYPGIERFKIAVQMNLTRWVNAPCTDAGAGALKGGRAGHVRLRPYVRDGENTLQRYDARTRSWRDEPTADGEVVLAGPFVYFACLLTDRLEPTFVPAPFSAPASAAPLLGGSGRGLDDGDDDDDDDDWRALCAGLARPAEAVDVVAIRPLRDPGVQALLASGETEAAAAAWYAAHRVGPVTAGMYNGGRHVQATYPPGAETETALGALEVDGAGACVVEYYRTGGYVWTAGPAPAERRARAACVDGTVRFADEVSGRVLASWAGRVGVWV